MNRQLWFIFFIPFIGCFASGCPGLVSIDGMSTGTQEPEPEPEPEPEADCDTLVPYEDTDSRLFFDDRLLATFMASPCKDCHVTGNIEPVYDETTAWSVARERIEPDATTASETTIGKIMQIDGVEYPDHPYPFANPSDGKIWVTYHLEGIGTCDDGGVVAPVDAGPQTGEENGPCFGNSTCNQGLTCVDDVCRAIATGDEGGPCFGNNTCNDQLACINAICTDITGQEGGPCFPNNTCNGGLICEGETCVSGPLCDGGPCEEPCFLPYSDVDSQDYFATYLLTEFVDCSFCHRSNNQPIFDETNAWEVAKARIEPDAGSAAETTIGQIMRVDGALYPGHDYGFDYPDEAKVWINYHLFGVEADPSQCTE